MPLYYLIVGNKGSVISAEIDEEIYKNCIMLLNENEHTEMLNYICELGIDL